MTDPLFVPVPPPDDSAERTPTDDELQEPSTEKEPEEVPKAPERPDADPDHEAVGIGVIGRPQVEPEQEPREEGSRPDEE